MKREEIVRLEDVRGSVPPYPLRFTIDGEPLEFTPLPLGTLLIIEDMRSRLKVNRQILQAAPIVGWLLVCKRQTNEVRKIVALLVNDGGIDFDVIKERLEFLREHCTTEDLCSLFIIGTALQNLWMRDAGTETSPSDYEGISHRELWDIPFVELKRQ